MEWASEWEDDETADMCREWGADVFDRIAYNVARYGHAEIVKLCKEWGANDFKGTMCQAARGGTLSLSSYVRSGERTTLAIPQSLQLTEGTYMSSDCAKSGE